MSSREDEGGACRANANIDHVTLTRLIGLSTQHMLEAHARPPYPNPPLEGDLPLLLSSQTSSPGWKLCRWPTQVCVCVR